jgi:serine/threonine protein phosphatase 1
VTDDLAFVGDIHGTFAALRGLQDVLELRGNPHIVFLGDYIDKGAQSAEVLGELLILQTAGRATLLLGNHELAVLAALETSDLAAFLKIGGAMTIRSYVGGDVGPDVMTSFRSSLPLEHVDALRRMPTTYELEDVIAQHTPPAEFTPKFRISAHIPVGKHPLIGSHAAHLDTGCGTDGGRLTALLWPSLDYLQVDALGTFVSD